MAGAVDEDGEVRSEIMRVFRFLQEEHTCITYLRNYLSSELGQVQLGYWNDSNWQLLMVEGMVGFFKEDKYLFSKLCVFFKEHLKEIYPSVDGPGERSLMAKTNLTTWILLPEALRYAVQVELSVEECYASHVVKYGYDSYLKLLNADNAALEISYTPSPQSEVNPSALLIEEMNSSSTVNNDGSSLQVMQNLPASTDSQNPREGSIIVTPAESGLDDDGSQTSASLSLTKQSGQSCYSGIRTCQMEAMQPATSIMHPSDVYKYANDGTYVAPKTAIAANKANVDPLPTNLGKQKSSLSTVFLHNQLRVSTAKAGKKQVDQVYELTVICLEKSLDMTLVEEKDELVRLERGGIGKVLFRMTKSLSAEETHAAFLKQFLPLRAICVPGRNIPYCFATRIGHSKRTQVKKDGPTSSKDLIELASRGALTLYLVPMYDLQLVPYTDALKAREKHDECEICKVLIPVAEIVAHVAAHRKKKQRDESDDDFKGGKMKLRKRNSY